MMPKGKHIKLSSRAQKDFRKMSSEMQERVKRSLKELADNPNSSDIKKLKGVGGREDLYRLRVGDHRIIYLPTESELLIIRMDHRKKVYDFLE